MGNEIVYCVACSGRLTGADLQSGNAYRVEDQICCANCIEDVIADLPAKQQEAILTQHQRKTAPIRKRTGSVPIQKSPTGRVPTQPVKKTTAGVPTLKKAGTGAIKKTTGKVPTQGVRKTTGGVPITKGTRKVTRPVPRADEYEEDDFDEMEDEGASKKKKIILISSCAGGGLLLLIVILIFAMSGGDDTPVNPAPGPRSARGPAPKAAAANPDAAADKAFKEAVLFQNNNPDDWTGQMAAFRKAEEIASNSPVSGDVENYINALLAKIDAETTRIIENTQANYQQKQFGTVLSVLEDALKRYDIPEWRQPLQARLDDVRGNVEDRYDTLREAAIDAKRRGNESLVQEKFQTLTQWKLGDYVKRLQRELAEVKMTANTSNPGTPNAANPGANPDTAPPPEKKELSEAVKAYRRVWEEAMGAAYGQKYDEALGRLEQAKSDAGDEDAKKEADADIKALKQVQALHTKGMEILRTIKPFVNISVKYEDFPKEYKEAAGIIVSRNDQRMKIRTKVGEEKKQKTLDVMVEHDAVHGASLASIVLKRGKKVTEDDRRAAGLICLIEGDEEAAKVLLAGKKRGIPARYWAHVKEAKDKAPTPDRTEFQARRLFHRAELEWAEIRTWGPAMEKYRMLNNDFAIAKITQQNLPVILRRMGMGKEYLYFPDRGLEMSGEFKTVKLGEKVADGQAVAAYQNPKDVEEYRAQTNFVEVEFYALPDHAYKVWVFAGACCKETFFTYFQSSEYKVREGGDTVVLDPGSDFAMPLKMFVRRVKNEHKDHKGEKEPARWAWIQIPTPREYQAPGPKAVRLFNDQKGFSVAYALISSSRKREPDPDETRSFIEKFNEKPVGGEKEALKGTPEPDAWLVAGPFDNGGGINKALPPETKFDPATEMAGKGGKKARWKEAKPALQNAGGGKAAVFKFDQIFTKDKTNATAYATIHVFSPEARAARILYGSDDQSKVWVNGRQVHRTTANRAVKVDGDRVSIRLEEGWNRVLFKVRQGSGAWGLAARFVDDQNKVIDGLMYHPYGELE